MYIAKKKLQHIKEQFKRDNALSFPVHTSDKKTPERDTFISALIKNKDFVPTLNKNRKKFEDSIRHIIKKFNGFDYFCIIILGLCAGTFSFGMAATNTQNNKKDTKNVTLAKKQVPLDCLVWATAGLLVGLCVGAINQISSARIKKDNDRENLFYRLSVRLFDLMHETYPDLDENILKACNPEMARVIHALLVANLSDADNKEIQTIATNLSKQLRDINQKNENNVLIYCDKEIKAAVSIIEHNLITNQALYDTMLNLYRGNIPTVFKIYNNQNNR